MNKHELEKRIKVLELELSNLKSGVSEEKLLKSEELFKSVIQNSSDLVVLTDEKGIVTYLSPQCEEVIGYLPSKIMGQIMPDFIHTDDKIRCQHEWEQVIFHEKELHDLEYRIFDGQNKERWISHSARMVKTNDKVMGMQNTIRNITERKKAEELLRNSDKKHSAMIENIGDVIAIVGADGNTKYQSSNVEKWFGWKPEELIGNNWDRIHPEDIERIQKEFGKVLENDNIRKVEYRFKCKDGVYKWIAVTASNRLNDTSINGVLLNYHDITESKQAEQALKESESQLLQLNADKDRFISILGHDLKSPFNNLLGLSELLTENIHNYDIDTIEKLVNGINISSRNTYDLLDDLLMWANSQQDSIAFKPKNLSLTDICTHIFEIIKPNADAKKITINCSRADHLEVFADNDMLKTILRNLVSNAIKFTDSSGTIVIGK